MSSLPKFTKKKKGKALIIEGGGMRGSFAGGVLSSMAPKHPPNKFDLIVAVSSGSCSSAYYVTEPNPSSEDIERALDIWRKELAGSHLISFWNLFRGKRILDQDYLIDHIFQEKVPIKAEVLKQKKTVPFYIVVSNFRTLQPEYIRATYQNLFPLLRAATSLPIATKGYGLLENSKYTDGGVLDPIPVEAVLSAGYKDITVILTKPLDFRLTPSSPLLGSLAFPKFPEMGKAFIEQRYRRYNRAMEILNDPPKGIRFEIIAPEKTLPAGRMTTNANLLTENVRLGIEFGKKVFPK